MVEVVLLFVVVLPIAWIISEFSTNRPLRLVLGLCAIAMSFGVAWVAGSLERLQANSYFAKATKDLIQNTFVNLKKGIILQFYRDSKTLDPTLSRRMKREMTTMCLSIATYVAYRKHLFFMMLEIQLGRPKRSLIRSEAIKATNAPLRRIQVFGEFYLFTHLTY